jgi:hypothetical protein
MIKYLDELRTLNLPKGKFSIFGSGPLAIRGLRENNDIDILVIHELWNDLADKYTVTSKINRPDSIYVGHIQILKFDYKDWQPLIKDPMVLITEAENIENFPFVKLEHLLSCKKLMGGEKHINDIALIHKFNASQK